MLNNCNETWREPDPLVIQEVWEQLENSYADATAVNADKEYLIPTEAQVREFLDDLIELIMPGFHRPLFHGEARLFDVIQPILYRVDEALFTMTYQSLKHLCICKNKPLDKVQIRSDATAVVQDFMRQLPTVREVFKRDVIAAYDGDPAAFSHDEVIVSYPGLRTLLVQRLAHILYHHKVPLVPRMMTEFMHRSTGIDIHPGAHIGPGVFIDHGTGVVVGETAIIGKGVKIYQGVTLGALSFPKDACGKLVRGIKRHPTIGDFVTIYAGATILGNVTIGDHSVIGGNVWITDSLPSNTKVTSVPPAQNISIR